MATFTKRILSGSTNGRPIKIATTSSPGTMIHTGSSTNGDLHEIWLWVANSDLSNNKKITIEFGGTTSPDDLIEYYLPPESGLHLIVPGLILNGNATPLVVRAFAESANIVTACGYVNVIA